MAIRNLQTYKTQFTQDLGLNADSEANITAFLLYIQIIELQNLNEKIETLNKSTEETQKEQLTVVKRFQELYKDSQ